MAEKYRKKARVTLNFSGRLIILRMGDFCVLHEFECTCDGLTDEIIVSVDIYFCYCKRI